MNAITAINNEQLLKKINNENKIKIISKNLQYREAILETLENNKEIELVFISEKIPGEISIEKLIKKIKSINKKIKIIFFLEKENIEKEKQLKKLGVKNIYKINNINLKKDKISKKGNLNIKKIKNKKIKNKKIKNKLIKNKLIKNKLILKNIIKNNFKKTKKIYPKMITVEGKRKTGKTTITKLIEKYLRENGEKVLTIYLNKKTEKSCIDILNNKFSKLYDFILVDICNNCSENIKDQIKQKSFKNLTVIDQNFLGIKGISDILEKQENSLHIVYNKYHSEGISKYIIDNILKKQCTIYKILYNKNYKNILKNHYEKSKKKSNYDINLKIDKKTKREIEKIIN